MWAVVIVMTWGTFQLGGFDTPDACVVRMNKEIARFVRTNQTIIAAQCEQYEAPKK